MTLIKTGSLLPMLKFLAFFWLLPLPLLSTAWASDISVQLVTEQAAVSLDDQIQIEVIVRGSRDSSQPEIQNLTNFDAQPAGTSSQIQIINGATTTQTTFTFILSPKQAGTFQIGPARVLVDNKPYLSDPLTLKVAKGMANSAPTPDSPFKVEGTVDNRAPYLNQQLIYTFRFLSRGRMNHAQLGLPEFKGFWKEQIGQQRDSEPLINGVPWRATEIQFALFPQSPGEISIEPAVLNGEALVENQRRPRSPFDNFFQDSFFFGGETKHLRLRTQPITIQVKPLPPTVPGQFFSGLVGSFRLNASLGKNQLAVGDSTTLSLRIEGQGNIRDARFPDLELKGFKTYDDQPSVDAKILGTKLGGSKTFKKALVPLEAGRLTIPAIHLVYFDPSVGRYQNADSQPMTLEVSAGTGKESLTHVSAGAPGSDQKEIVAKGEDLMPVKRELNSWNEPLGTPARRGFWFFDLACPLLSLAGIALLNRQRRRSVNLSQLKRQRAYRRFQTELKQLSPGSNYFERASSLLRGYLGDKFDFDGMALTPADTRRKLGTVGLSESSLRAIEEFLKLCERGQYGGESQTTDSMSASQASLMTLVKTLEKEILA